MERLRPASPADVGFLEAMLVLAVDWRPGTPSRPVPVALDDPELARYVVDWPRPGDFGVIAEDAAGRPLGAAWCRTFPAAAPGYGFVSPEIPELSIAVLPTARGQGVGRALMERLVAHARAQGVACVSLSVEVGNSARDLYISLGFTVVEEHRGSTVMVLDLDGRNDDAPPLGNGSRRGR
ncbi:MAG: N-acetyltransferase family protein [Actinomycetota bacterium]